MRSVLNTLFYPIEQGAVRISGARLGFIAAQFHPILEQFRDTGAVFQQHFKPDANIMEAHGFQVFPSLPDCNGELDVALVLLPKNIVESRYMLASVLKMLRPGGIIVAAADNKAGGGRIRTMFSDFGLEDYRDESKNKARVAWAVHSVLDKDRIDTAIKQGDIQPVLGGSYVSQPGVFGWNKIDCGSEQLIKCLPADLCGVGADFGCGYGYLAHEVLGKCKKISQFCCLDADSRAVALCRTNLEHYDVSKQFLWADLTKKQADIGGLDFVLMNPPFHAGKKTDVSIGQAFIGTAMHSLKKGGALWMVANANLPYEKVLSQCSSSFSKEFEGKGFKVYRALR